MHELLMLNFLIHSLKDLEIYKNQRNKLSYSIALLKTIGAAKCSLVVKWSIFLIDFL